MKILQKLKNFYNASAENKTQLRIFLGFVIIPVITMTALFIYFYFFVLK